MRRHNGVYIHEGNSVSFMARPILGLGIAVALSVFVAQFAFDRLVKKWFPWAKPLSWAVRNVSYSWAAMAFWAGLGIEILRIGESVYIHGKWIERDQVASVQGPGAPNFLREGVNKIILKSGQIIETERDLTILRRYFGIEG